MERIYVTVRARPLSAEDAKSSPWRISGNSINLTNQSAKFEFDRIFGEGCTTREVYEARTKEIVASVVRGFNGTVFAYGQTNSGKTHTMRGSITEPGIIPLAVHDLFQSIEENSDREFLVRMSYMEIYNEEINDLLAPEHRRLQIHESLERGIFVAGLREEIVVSPEQIIDLMEFGESHRHVGETNMNVHSSRSHTIFRMIIESREKTDDHADADADSQCDAVRVSILNLVDLAGSERAAKTGAEGVRLKEGSHINKSLMTLGTVIKKLSEGTESQGGHVPYRDSKLTRILQPALGGNANTAIICNITLAQIHSEETKSSLQFASRAIRVTNCACVNEILTDAALLKRQQKEIEELRARMLASHSEHWEQEILNLRNTLLQSELEKERIALELEEEKKAKAQRERRLQEQEIKIANLSSMVLDTKRDDKASLTNKSTRRNTWCPGPLALNPGNGVGAKKNVDLPVPFEDLVEKNGAAMLEDIPEDVLAPKDTLSGGDCSLPDARALLHVTSRRKVQHKNAGSPMVHSDVGLIKQLQVLVLDLVRNYDSLFELYDLQIFVKKLQQPNTAYQLIYEMNRPEIECFGSNLFGLASSQVGTASRRRGGKVEKERVKNRDLHLRNICHSTFTIALMLSESLFFSLRMGGELKALASQSMEQIKVIADGHEKLHGFMKTKNAELEIEKGLLHQQTSDLHKRIQELLLDSQERERAMNEAAHQHKSEKDKLLDQIHGLQKEVSCLSSSSLVKEKEATWKELEKTKSKLKDTESKLRNTIQDKVRLESEKAQAEREIKHLHSQRNLLERDVSKRESIARRESKAHDFNKSKGHGGPANQIRQADYEKLEICAFEMEAEIASLEEKLMAAITQKEEVFVKNVFLEEELEALSNKLNTADSELNLMREEIGSMTLKLDECECTRGELEASHDLISREKEEMAMQLTDALLEFEAEKSAWSTTEKALLDSDEKSRNEIALLSESFLKVKGELESCCKQSEILERRLALSKENSETERESSLAKLLEIAQLRSDLEKLEIDSLVYEDELSEQILNMEVKAHQVGFLKFLVLLPLDLPVGCVSSLKFYCILMSRQTYSAQIIYISYKAINSTATTEYSRGRSRTFSFKNLRQELPPPPPRLPAFRRS
ncbi:unnamed protein product [Spirodela intermedia]|uniref:Kinesin motor domain-containing protein n=1 Tax=Spirodela intermedia TaxID=51605 RepID=A0A7I8LFP3_SPIIN|nr:unnamed protein product [Spirodela intermedia]